MKLKKIKYLQSIEGSVMIKSESTVKEEEKKGGNEDEKDEPEFMSSHMVARWYRPPEIILSNDFYDQKVDVWSLGCILAEMAYIWD
jgi:serine/threonine protein kinase